MKPLFCTILSLFLLFTADAQPQVLQAGRRYLVVNEEGSFRFDSQPLTQLYLGIDDRIYTKDHNLYLTTGNDRDRSVRFLPSDAEADKLIYEDNTSGSGQFIKKRFPEGTLYLVVSRELQLEWRKSPSEGMPVLLQSYYQIGSEPTTTNDRIDRRRTDPKSTGTRRESSPEEIAAAQKKLQEAADAAAEKKRQEAAAAAAAPKNTLPMIRAQAQGPLGRIEVRLVGFKEKCIDYFTDLRSTTDSDFRGMREKFKPNCQANFSGLKDGTYEVYLYVNVVITDDFIDPTACDNCGQKLVSNNTVTILNGNQRVVKFESK